MGTIFIETRAGAGGHRHIVEPCPKGGGGMIARRFAFGHEPARERSAAEPATTERTTLPLDVYLSPVTATAREQLRATLPLALDAVPRGPLLPFRAPAPPCATQPSAPRRPRAPWFAVVSAVAVLQGCALVALVASRLSSFHVPSAPVTVVEPSAVPSPAALPSTEASATAAPSSAASASPAPASSAPSAPPVVRRPAPAIPKWPARPRGDVLDPWGYE